jgi:hypothetical protein
MDGLQNILNEFLGDHPEHIADVQWMDLPGGGRELMMKAEATKVFADWAQKKKGADLEKVAKQKALIDKAIAGESDPKLKWLDR